MFIKKTIIMQALAFRIAFCAAGIVLLAGCSSRSDASTGVSSVAIAVQRAVPAGATSIYDGPGSVTARHVYKLAFEIPGRVAALPYDVGERVAAGAVIARLDDADYAAQADAASAQADVALATARKADDGARAQERAAAAASVDAARGQLDRALAAATLARANASRARLLLADGAISAQQADAAAAAERDAEGAVASARAQLAAALDAASLVREGARIEDRAAAQAQSAAAEAQARLAAVTLGKTALVAPADGVVEARDIEVGDQAQPGVVAIVVEDAATPDVMLAVPERYATMLHRGDPARISSGASVVRGTIFSIEPAADAASRTLAVRIRASRLDMPLGTVVDVAIGAGSASAGAAVPIGAVMKDPETGADRVELLDPSGRSVVMRPVRVVKNRGDELVVTGVAPGDKIVVAGEYEARPGMQVRVVAQDVPR